MSCPLNTSSRKRLVESSDSDSDDDYYSKMVDRAINSDDERASVSSISSLEHSDGLELNKSDDEFLELDAQRDFDAEMKEAARKAKFHRQKRYRKELAKVAKQARVKEYMPGAEPRAIHVISNYEESIRQLKEVNAAVEELNSNKGDQMECMETPEKPKDTDNVNLTVNMLDHDNLSNMDFTWPMKNRLYKLFEEIAMRLETSVDTVKVYLDNERIEQWQKPEDLKMTPGDKYFLDCMTIGLNTKKNPTVKFQMAGRRPILLTVMPTTTFGEIKKLLAEKGAPQFEKLIFDDAVMSDDKTLQDVGMEHNDVVDAM